jgi:hypothetical protein
MTHYPKIKGSKAATGTGRDNMAEKKLLNLTILHDSTMMEHLTLNLKIKGSNAATSIGREKLVLVFTHYNTVVDY